jgi:hypothetical protein
MTTGLTDGVMLIVGLPTPRIAELILFVAFCQLWSWAPPLIASLCLAESSLIIVLVETFLVNGKARSRLASGREVLFAYDSIYFRPLESRRWLGRR